MPPDSLAGVPGAFSSREAVWRRRRLKSHQRAPYAPLSHVLHLGNTNALPNRTVFSRSRSLSEARGHVNQQPVAGDVAEGQGLQVEGDRLQGPSLDQGARLGLQAVPEILDKVEETAAAGLLPA